MEYKEFVDRVANEIGDKLPKSLKGAEITARQVDKLQNEGYYGITVAPKKSNIGISLDMKSAFDNFEHGASFSEVLESVAQAITQGFENQPKVNAAEIQDYGAMKEKLMIQVVPIAGNEEMLATVPHVNKEDMSIVFRLVLDTNEQQSATALVNNDMMKEYGISLDQLYEDAMKNAPEKFPASIRRKYAGSTC